MSSASLVLLEPCKSKHTRSRSGRAPTLQDLAHCAPAREWVATLRRTYARPRLVGAPRRSKAHEKLNGSRSARSLGRRFGSSDGGSRPKATWPSTWRSKGVEKRSNGAAWAIIGVATDTAWTPRDISTHNTDTFHNIGSADQRAWQLEGADGAHPVVMGTHGTRQGLAWRGKGSGSLVLALRQPPRYMATFPVTVTSAAAAAVTAAVTIAA